MPGEFWVEGERDQGGAVLPGPRPGHEDGGDGGGGELGSGGELWLGHQGSSHWTSTLLLLLSHLKGDTVKMGQCFPGSKIWGLDRGSHL